MAADIQQTENRAAPEKRKTATVKRKPAHRFTVVKGRFMPSEAGRMLFDLVNSKINFHAMEIFRIQEQFGGDVSRSQNRIRELNDIYRSLKLFLKTAEEKKYQLKITGTIEITVVNK